MTPHEAVKRFVQLVTLPEGKQLLVLPSLANGPQSGTHPQIAAALLDRVDPDAILGLPDSTPLSIKRRWQHLAKRQGIQTRVLGTNGWDRVEFHGDAYRLDAAYMPSEVMDAASRIVMPALADESLALGFWRERAHPHTKLRTHNAERSRMVAEVSTAVRSHYLLDASRLPSELSIHLLAWTSSAVAAELVGLGLRRYIAEAQGFEKVGPWESPRVQAATEIGHGPASGSAILLRADPALDRVRTLVVYLADQLGCGIEWATERSAGDRE